MYIRMKIKVKKCEQRRKNKTERNHEREKKERRRDGRRMEGSAIQLKKLNNRKYLKDKLSHKMCVMNNK